MSLPTVPILAFTLRRMAEMKVATDLLAHHLNGTVPDGSVRRYMSGGSIHPDHLDMILVALRIRLQVLRRSGGGPVAWIKREWATGEVRLSVYPYSNSQIFGEPPLRKVVTWRMKQQQLRPHDLADRLDPEVPERSIYRYLKGGSLHPDHLGRILAALHLEIDLPGRWGGGSKDVKDWGWGDGKSRRRGQMTVGSPKSDGA